jgi:hypothetical protein
MASDADEKCNGCGGDSECKESDNGQDIGCKCNAQGDEDAVWRADDGWEADMIEYQRVDR